VVLDGAVNDQVNVNVEAAVADGLEWRRLQ
jgi:hypothetical protein